VTVSDDLARDAHKQRRIVFFLVFGCALWYAFVSQAAWEDWYITYRASRNLAMGHGLSFVEGRHIYSFTSPIGTLLPALLCLLTSGNDELVLWLFRIIGAATLGLAAVLLLEYSRTLRYRPAAAAVLLGLFALDSKIVGFGVSGMETAFMMACLAFILHTLAVPGAKPVLRLGLGFGAVMWTRPDGFIYGGALALGFLLAGTPNTLGQSRGAVFKGYLQAIGISLLVYAPWFFWTWSYYGTPIPNTVAAKALNDSLLGHRLTDYWHCIFGIAMDRTLLPAYAGSRYWLAYEILLPVFKPIQLAGLFYWLWPRGQKAARAASLAFLFGHFYLNVVVPFAWPWYYPSIGLLAFVSFAGLVQDLLVHLEKPAVRLKPAWALLLLGPAAALAAQAVVFVCAAYEWRVQHQVIELGNRKQIGLWLKEHAGTDDTVMLECLGYIGFYSGLRTYDFPGMSSPEMVAARRKLGTDNWAPLIRELRPDWLVMRPTEIGAVNHQQPELLQTDYHPVALFDVSQQVAAYRWLPGRNFLMFDQEFLIFHRTAADPATKPPS
jgi:hypothetical protein